MNYKNIYNQIILKRQETPFLSNYSEKHHIIPKSLGGTDDEDNLVRLSGREHFICHYLLAKMYKKETFEWYKMNHAFMMMKPSSSHKRYFNSKLYEALKVNFSKVMSFNQAGEKNSQFGTIWMSNIESKTNIKVDKKYVNQKIFEGYIPGRSLWNKIKNCNCCGKIFFQKEREGTCSIECRETLIEYSKYKKYTKEVREIISNSSKGHKRQSGKKNSQYGLKFKWITNEISNKKLPLEKELPKGWKYGRCTKEKFKKKVV